MASRKEQKEALRAERLEREREAATKERRRRLVGYGVGGALVLAVIAVIAVLAVSGGGSGGGDGDGQSASADFPKGTAPAQRTTELSAAAQAAGCKLSHPANEGRGHTNGKVTY